MILVLPDAGPEAVAAAQSAVQELVHHPDAPAVRLDLIADLLANNLLGFAPGDPIEPLLKKLGPPAQTQGALSRWPALGIELWSSGGRVQRIALHARPRGEMKIFVGEVLVGAAALTQRAPDLRIQQVAPVLGVPGARGLDQGSFTELAWRRGSSTLFLTFDDVTTALEAIVLEPFDAQLWASMKPLEQVHELWDISPEQIAGAHPNRIEFAQVPAEINAADVPRMRLIASRQPRAKAFFDNLEARFLAPGESLRRIHSGRAAMLRASGCAYLVLEKPDGSWDARNPNSVCDFQDEPKGLAKIASTFAAK